MVQQNFLFLLTAMPCTSRPRAWGKGTAKKDPGEAVRSEYYKWNVIRRWKFDVRPSYLQTSTLPEEEIAHFVNEINADEESASAVSMWELTMPREYEDFSSDDSDVAALRQLCDQFYEGLRRNITSDPHLIPGTGAQASSEVWTRHRQLLFTSSEAKKVLGLSSPATKLGYLREHLWGLGGFEGNEATRYGSRNESTARKSYEVYQRTCDPTISVKTTGLWVKKSFPHLGCSPDGLVVRLEQTIKLVEIKCPPVLSKIHPREFEKLTKQQQQNLSIRRDDQGNIVLKKTHPHYYQVQFQMDVMKVQRCDYVVWSRFGFLIIPVRYDKDFWVPKRDRLHKLHRELLVVEYFQKRAVRRLPPEALSL